ncbi:MAG: gluconolaconase [Acidobacteria bacterium]|nr:gluconolaconase [Acidobacteriota bacterium]
METAKTPAGWRARVTTLAGAGSPGSQDGAALQARFQDPFGVAVGADGTVYATDGGESNAIRKLTPEGLVSKIAGGEFDTPSGLALDGAGNLYVADTGKNRVRKVSKEGVVTTLAGAGEFDAPVGVALDKDGNVYVADTYNDRIRVITKDGQVRTIAGSGGPGYADGSALDAALFDTPCGVAVSEAGDIYVADTGNDRLRKITKDGQVSTLNLFESPAAQPNSQNASGMTPTPPPGETNPSAFNLAPFELSNPAGLAVTRDGFIYVTELDRGRIVQVAPDGAARVIAGRGGPGFADGEGRAEARFNQPAGLALFPDGSLVVADGANYLLRRVSPFDAQGEKEKKEGVAVAAQPDTSQTDVLPRIEVESLGAPFPWPLDPQTAWHEVTATMGEARGSYNSNDSRDHLHSGMDVFGVYGQTVRAVREEKVTSPLANWGFGTLNEGFRAGLMTYVHVRVGRSERDEPLDPNVFIPVRDPSGKVVRVRVRRGTRLRVGQALGTINRMYHVHMNLGPPGAESNPLALPFNGFGDHFAPRINRDGVQLFDESGARLTEKRAGRLVVRGRVRVVVDAFDQVDGNQPRRRLGLYKLGYQLLLPDGSPAPGFGQSHIGIEFDRLPPDREAPKIAYADESGITVYGSAETRFLYEVTNTVRHGRAERGVWDTATLPPGDYTLRILAADFAGNEADANRDVPITLER